MSSIPPKENTLTIHHSRSDTQSAILNVLTDYQAHADENSRTRRALLNVLEDLEQSNNALVTQTQEMAETAERQLQKNAITTAILESMGDAIIVTNSSLSITFVNRAFEVVTGWTADEVIGRDIVTILSKESLPWNTDKKFSSITAEVLAGSTHIGDITNPSYSIRKNGVPFPTSSTMTPIWLHGAVIGLVKSFRDITKELDIDKAKTEFVSLASHQLRAPLSAINWYTEMLLAGDVGAITEGQEKYLHEVYQGNQRMISLVNALLNVTRITLGTFIMEPETVNFCSLIENVLHEQKATSDKKNLQVKTTHQPNIPIIESDSKLLRMVLQNLISNAIKYTPDDGLITIHLGIDTSSEHFLFTITDTGIGIPSEQHDRIFTRLFRADNARVKDTEGNGLGLYIVKAIIENLGGRVWFESEESKGSTFYVELPVATSQ